MSRVRAPNLHLAWRGSAPAFRWVAVGLAGEPPLPVTSPARLAVLAGSESAAAWPPAGRPEGAASAEALAQALPAASVAAVFLEPEPGMVEPAARGGAWHASRWADGTVKPLPPAPGRLVLASGDAYIALLPAESPLPAEALLAAARFTHLHDSFNADDLAQALVEHLAGLARLAVLVVEAR